MKNSLLALVASSAALIQSSQAFAHHEVSSAINAEGAFVAAAAVLVVTWQLVKNRR